jgi:hypothetical protein
VAELTLREYVFAGMPVRLTGGANRPLLKLETLEIPGALVVVGDER